VSVVTLSAGGASAPRLRPELTIVEQVFRGETSYVVKDPATRKYFRFRPVEIGVMRCFDGLHSAEEIAATLAGQGIRLTARAVDGFARKLAGIGLLERTLADRTTLELERVRADRRKRRRPALFRGEIMRMRWSLGDPDAMFTRVMPALRWCFTPGFIVASVALFAAYFIILAATWTEFSSTLVELYALGNITLGTIVVLSVTGLVVILIHELGHGFACKHFGGEVHELGFMLMYFQPAFYCNVNDAWSFPALRARLWVTAAGGWIQFVVASLAAVVWLVARPGTLTSEVAVAAMIVGGATTLVTNMNPLIPLDGYFALTDWLEIPNLRIRAREYFGWWVRRHALRMALPEPAATDRERRVFLIYGALAACYIGGIFAFVALWTLGKARDALGAVGVVIVASLIVALTRRAIAEWGRAAFLAVRARRAERGSSRRGRMLPFAGAVGLVLLGVMPWTVTTSGRLVVVPARTTDLVAPDSGIIGAVLVREGTRVAAGVPVARIVDHALERDLLAALGTVDSMSVARSRARAIGAVAVAARLEEENREALARLSAVQSRVDALTLRARSAGVVTTPRVELLQGTRVTAGQHVMTIATLDSLEARVALAGAGATTVKAGHLAHLVMYGDPSRPASAAVATVAPAGGGGGGRNQGTIEARIPLLADGPWRAGATGEASVELRRSTVLAALWWNVRQRLRGDILL
jgi:multidrug efflux pump subunit AcrA (membrane-fusion protein)